MLRLFWWGQEMGELERIITPAPAPAAALPPRPAAQAQAPAHGGDVVIPDLRVIAQMTSPAALAAATGRAAPAPRAQRVRPAPEEEAELDRAWATAHVND